MTPSEHRIEALLLHDGFVRALARSLLADAHAADDIAQQTWVVALEDGGRAESTPRWLAGIVRHLAGRFRHVEGRQRRHEHERTRPEETPAAAEILERESARARVVEAVLALEEPQREAVLLRYFENLPPRRIAKRLGVPVETVRTRLKRALSLLRARLDREYGGEREAWSVLLLPFARALRPTPLGHGAESLAPVLPSLLLMSTQTKLAVAVAGAALISVWWVAERGSPTLSGDEGVASAASVALQSPPSAAPPELAASEASAPHARVSVRAPTATAPARAGGSLRVRVTWFDGSPAAGIRVLVEPNWSEQGVTLNTRYGLTDAQGAVRLEELPAGAALVSLDRGPVDVAVIAAEREAELALTIPLGIDVSGVVLDPSGTPVPAAEVWVSSQLQVEEGLVLAEADARGRFELRSLPTVYIGARARGFAPSLCQMAHAGEGTELALELVLMGPGGAVEGSVFGLDGRPLADAWVAVGLDHPLGRVQMVPVGGEKPVSGNLSGPIEARTDAEGRYRIDGLAPGTRRMAVRAPGLGAWRGEVEVVEQRTRGQDVRLEQGVTLEGRILLSDGRPASASVEVGEARGILRSFAATDEEGAFRLAGIEVGELVVRANGGHDGEAGATLHGAAGETLTWEARLVKGGSIQGRVLLEGGAPVVGWQLRVQDEPRVSEDHDLDFVETDAEGRFEFQDMHDRPHRVELRFPADADFPVAVASGIFPEREELVLCIGRAQMPSARVRGLVVDELGQPLDGAQVLIGRETLSGARIRFADSSGVFDLGPLPPGRWVVCVRAPELAELPDVVLGPRELVAGEVWECGTIVSGGGGTLRVTAAGVALAPEAAPEFRVLRDGVFPSALVRNGEAWRSDPLQAGSYRLEVRGRGVAAAQIPFEIQSGAVTRLEVPLSAGTPVELRVHANTGAESQVLLRITAAQGALVLADEIWLRQDAEGIVHPGDYGTEVSLAPGRYRVEVWLEDGPRAAAELEVEQGEPRALLLELR